MNITTSTSPEADYFDWESSVAEPVLGIERRGIPTRLTKMHKEARSVSPPRATFLDFPSGCVGGRPGARDQQRVVVRAAIETGTCTTEDAAWELPLLQVTWVGDDNRHWEDLLVDLYRVDNTIRGPVRATLSEHRENLAQQRAFTIRRAC
jgi:D-proline reductase (dithiol) PrdB